MSPARVRSSSLRLFALASCVSVALLAFSPLPSLAQVVSDSGAECAKDPAASISVGGFAAANGAIFECPTNAQGELRVTFGGVQTHHTSDGLMFRGSTSASICPASGGSCLSERSGDPSSTAEYSRSLSATLTTPGAYKLQVSTRTSPQSGQFTINPIICSAYDNKQCVARCRTCEQTLSAICYYKDPVGLAAAKAASPTGGVGSDSGTIIGAPLQNGVPFRASSFGASLPLRSGETLNPRCKLDSLVFRTPFGSSGVYTIPLPPSGSDEVVIRDCANITPEQVATLTNPATSFGSASTLLVPQTPLKCKNVVDFRSPSSNTQVYDESVTSYAFAGDLRVTRPVSSSSSLVCADTYAGKLGPVAGLPAASWRSSSFSVTASHTTRFSMCDDESCIGGNADGACSACSYTYRVRFACDEQPPQGEPDEPATPPPQGGSGGIIGDPQFVGLRGQKYQVHGVSGEVYNIVSSPSLQYNARFVFLSSGACPTVGGKVQRAGCYSHPGSYLGELGLKTAGGDQLRIEAGGAAQGFAAVTFNERELSIGETVLLSDSTGFLSRNSSHVVSVTAGQWSFVFDNSDRFVNQRVAVSGEVAALRSHGLLGQTWRERTYPHSPIKCVQGAVDDYVIREKDVFGDEFAFNAFN